MRFVNVRRAAGLEPLDDVHNEQAMTLDIAMDRADELEEAR